MALRACKAQLCQVLIQPLHYQSDSSQDVLGWKKTWRGRAGGQTGTGYGPASQRPFAYDGPVNIPMWHHMADIWRPEQQPQAFVGHHLQSLDGEFDTTPSLIAVRPLIEDIIRHRNSEDGADVAMARWEGARKGFDAGIFDEACLHRVGFYALDVFAEKKDVEKSDFLYKIMHDRKEKGGLGLAFDASHFEKIILANYNAESYSGAIREFEKIEYNPSMPKGWQSSLKTQVYAMLVASYGRELDGARGIKLFRAWEMLGRDIHTFPHYQLTELLMGCIDEEHLLAKKVLRSFNDFYIEKVYNATALTKMDNDQMIYYAEWLFKARRPVMLSVSMNHSYAKYALTRTAHK
eukprot:TRINITY_DN7898_c0_g1_i1.p1 TRINITY_DN7898_c0_g1~~TRINITY_DN7898_c0_g1_i1.p1  ORF type:complete len:349 (+),score=55.98 TRINITY_DN7898_c0_g1_i1:38-1084(+)